LELHIYDHSVEKVKILKAKFGGSGVFGRRIKLSDRKPYHFHDLALGDK